MSLLAAACGSRDEGGGRTAVPEILLYRSCWGGETPLDMRRINTSAFAYVKEKDRLQTAGAQN